MYYIVDNPNIPCSTILHLLLIVGVVKSKSEARRLIESGGIYLNNERIQDPNREISTDDLILWKYILLRKGKKDYQLVKFVDIDKIYINNGFLR